MTGPDWAWPTQAASPTVTAGVGPSPFAPGTLKNCTAYDQYYASASTNITTYNINSCYAVAKFHGATTSQLVAWNPSLTFDSNNPESCVLASGLRYCVSMIGANATAVKATTLTTAPATATSPPASTVAQSLTGTCSGGTSPPEQVQSGISCKCNKWVEQQNGKYCADMATAAGLSLQQLYTLNPALKGDCSGLFVGYAYCVGLAS